MAINISLGKRSLQQPFEIFIPEQIQWNGFVELDVTISYSVHVAALLFPLVDHLTHLIGCSSLKLRYNTWQLYAATGRLMCTMLHASGRT
jgi:hypothetical protein